MLVRVERKVGRNDPDDRRNDIARDGSIILDGADELDDIGRKAELLIGLAQRSGESVLALVDPAAGESDLPGMGAQMLAPDGQDDSRLGAVGDRDQHGGGHACARMSVRPDPLRAAAA